MGRLTVCLLTFALLIGSILCGMAPPSTSPSPPVRGPSVVLRKMSIEVPSTAAVPPRVPPVRPPVQPVVPPAPRFVPRLELPKAPTPGNPAVLPPRLQVAPKPPLDPAVAAAIKNVDTRKIIDIGGLPIVKPSIAKLAKLGNTILHGAIVEKRVTPANVPTTTEGLKKLYYEEIWNNPEKYKVEGAFTKGLRVQYGDPRIQQLVNQRMLTELKMVETDFYQNRLPKARELKTALAADHLERIQITRPLSAKYKGLTIRELGIDKDDQATWNSKVASEADVEKWLERQVQQKGQKYDGDASYYPWKEGKDAPWLFGFGEAGRWKKAVDALRQQIIDKAVRQKNGIPAPMTLEEKQAKQLDDLDAQYAAQRQQQQQQQAAVKSGLDLDDAQIQNVESKELNHIAPKPQLNRHKLNKQRNNNYVHVSVNVF